MTWHLSRLPMTWPTLMTWQVFETMVYSMSITASLGTAFAAVWYMDAVDEEPMRTLAQSAGYVAFILLAIELLFFLKYCRNTWLLMRLERQAMGLQWRAVENTDRKSGREVRMGRELTQVGLHDALKNGQTLFSPAEMDAWGIESVHRDDFVRTGGKLYVPEVEEGEKTQSAWEQVAEKSVGRPFYMWIRPPL